MEPRNTRGILLAVVVLVSVILSADGQATCPNDDWKEYGNDCYYSPQYYDSKNFAQAEEHCRDLAASPWDSYLTSIHSVGERDFILNNIGYQYLNAWIGLKKESTSSSFSWVDGTSLTYTAWDEGEPNGEVDQEWCVEFYSDGDNGGTWNDIPCTTFLNYVCKTAKAIPPTTPVTPSQQPGYCPYGDWEPYGSDCFLFEPDKSNTWSGAKEECEGLVMGAQLASVTDATLNWYIQTKLQDKLISSGNKRVWFGLYQTGEAANAPFEWVDGSNSAYRNWAPGEPNGEGRERCVEMYTDSGTWNDHFCTSQNGYVCRVSKSASPPSTPDPASGVCPLGSEWKEYGNNCFYFPTGHESKTFDEARRQCYNLASGGWMPELASITSEAEKNWVDDNIAYNSVNAWIGLRKEGADGPFQWLDGSALEYTAWAPGEPNDFDGSEPCVELYTQWDAQWNDAACDNRFSYICKTPKGPAAVTPTKPPPAPGYCPSDSWEDYGEYCFLFEPDKSQTWDAAKQQCENSANGAVLASMRNGDENWFIYTRLYAYQGSEGNKGVWFGLYQTQEDIDTDPGNAPWTWLDGTQSDYRNWAPGEPNGRGSEPCVEIYTESGTWNDHRCSSERGYVCRVEKSSSPPQPGECGEGWSSNGDNCYYFGTSAEESSMSWHGAQDWCRQNSAEMASILSNAEQQFVEQRLNSLIFNGDMWLGYNQLQDRQNFRWSDSSPSNFEKWATDEPQNREKQMCTYIAQSNNEACFTRNEGIDTIEGLFERPADEDRPNTFYFGYLGWQDDPDSCLEKCNNEPQCMSYTYIKNTEPDFVWKGECFGRSNFRNVRESNVHAISGDRTICTATGTDWYSANCGKPKAFICKKPKGAEGTNSPPATPTLPGYCPQGFFEVGNKCYRGYERNFNDGVNWDTALSQCRQGPGVNPSLASFHTPQEAAAVTSRLEDFAVGYWMGYYMEGDSWMWSDNSPTDFDNWAPNEPGTSGECGEVWTFPGPPGTWNNVNCADKRGFICQTYKDPDNVVNTPPSTTRNTCPLEFTSFMDGCYKLESTPRSWNAAVSRCSSLGAKLVSIHSEAENAMVYLMADNYRPVWLGLKKSSQGEYEWSDGWPSTFTKWASNEPADNGGCVAVTEEGGLWSDRSCTAGYAAICKKTDATPETTPAPVAGVCPNDNWEEFGGHCYYFSTYWERRSFDSAESHCQTEAGNRYEAHLVSIHSQAENQFVRDNVNGNQFGKDVWIGLSKANSGSPMRWSDGSVLQYTAWAPGEPNDHDGNELCVEQFNGLWPGLWNDVPCDRTMGFVCKTEKGPPPTVPTTPPAVAGECPPGPNWEPYGEFCFLIQPNANVSWDGAQQACVTAAGRGAKLASIRDSAENYFVWQHLKAKRLGNSPPVSAWIGYIQTKQDLESDPSKAPWTWFDGTEGQYKNWAPNEPNGEGRENCVETYYDTGEWNDHFCYSNRGYVCKIRKTGITTPTISTTFSGSTETAPSGGGTSAGTTAGIVIGALLAIAALAAVVLGAVMYIRKRQEGGASPGYTSSEPYSTMA